LAAVNILQKRGHVNESSTKGEVTWKVYFPSGSNEPL